MKYRVLLLFLFWVSGAYAQAFDKLPDTAKVNRMIMLAMELKQTNLAKSDSIINEVLKISKAIHYRFGIASYYGHLASRQTNEIQLDSAKLSIRKAKEYLEGDNSVLAKKQLANLYNTYGVIYQQQQLYDSAVMMYHQVIRISDETGNRFRKAYTLYNLTSLYSFLNDTAKTEQYARLALAEANKTNDTALILNNMVAMANYFAMYRLYDSLPPYTKPALALADKIDDMYSKATLLHIMSDYYASKNNFDDSTVACLEEALRLFQTIKRPYEEGEVLYSLGNLYLSRKNNSKAIEYLDRALQIQNDNDLLHTKITTLLALSAAEANSGNISHAYTLLKEYVSLKDSLDKKTNEEMVQTLEARFQLRNKEDTIALQQSQISRKNLLNAILAGSAIALAIILVLGYRNYTHRRRLQQQRIADLETEKQLLATQSLLKGQEDERNRLAKDLHDGLGGMLSGVKLQLGAMKGNLILTEENGALFNSALNKLDESISEMRRVAHNMMPEALIRLGLKQALQDYCDGISASRSLTVNTEFYGLELRMEATTEVTVYRIVQELINNAVKHAEASGILVQVMRQNQSLNITVEDNGKGFDATAWQEMNTAGLQNIRSRVDYLQGRIDIKSRPGNGTSVYVECTIEDHG